MFMFLVKVFDLYLPMYRKIKTTTTTAAIAVLAVLTDTSPRGSLPVPRQADPALDVSENKIRISSVFNDVLSN